MHNFSNDDKNKTKENNPLSLHILSSVGNYYELIKCCFVFRIVEEMKKQKQAFPKRFQNNFKMPKI